MNQNQDSEHEDEAKHCHTIRHQRRGGHHTTRAQYVQIEVEEAAERQNRCEGLWPHHQEEVKHSQHLNGSDDLTRHDGDDSDGFLLFGPVLRGCQVVHGAQTH